MTTKTKNDKSTSANDYFTERAKRRSLAETGVQTSVPTESGEQDLSPVPDETGELVVPEGMSAHASPEDPIQTMEVATIPIEDFGETAFPDKGGRATSSALGYDGDAIVEQKVTAALDTGNETSERSGNTAPAESGTYTSVTGGDAMSTHTISTPQSENPESTASTSDSGIITETQLIVPAIDSDSIRRTVKQRKSGLSEYRATFLPVPRIKDRKPVFLSGEVRDRLDRIVRLFGERGMSVSGFVENIALHHLTVHEADIEHWRKM
jgi:hypothetical protein